MFIEIQPRIQSIEKTVEHLISWFKKREKNLTGHNFTNLLKSVSIFARRNHGGYRGEKFDFLAF